MNRIPELRKERGISMKQAAEQLGMPYTTYVNYEKGVRQPNSETLIDLANFYNTSIDYMLGKSNNRIDEHTLDVVNEIDQDILEKAGNVKEALRLQAKRDAETIPPRLPAHAGDGHGPIGGPDRLRYADHGGTERGAHSLCAVQVAFHLYTDLQGRQHGAPDTRW